MRLRPILMTCRLHHGLAAAGLQRPGSEMRAAMGAAGVRRHALGVTRFGAFLTPIFYVVLLRSDGQNPRWRQMAGEPSIRGRSRAVT